MADESTLTKHIWNEQNIVLSNFGFDFTGQIENESRTLVRFKKSNSDAERDSCPRIGFFRKRHFWEPRKHHTPNNNHSLE